MPPGHRDYSHFDVTMARTRQHKRLVTAECATTWHLCAILSRVQWSPQLLGSSEWSLISCNTNIFPGIMSSAPGHGSQPLVKALLHCSWCSLHCPSEMRVESWRVGAGCDNTRNCHWLMSTSWLHSRDRDGHCIAILFRNWDLIWCYRLFEICLNKMRRKWASQTDCETNW